MEGCEPHDRRDDPVVRRSAAQQSYEKFADGNRGRDRGRGTGDPRSAVRPVYDLACPAAKRTRGARGSSPTS
jgi:hypothetical protein